MALAVVFSSHGAHGITTVGELEKAASEGIASLTGDTKNKLPSAGAITFEGYVTGFMLSLKTGGMISLVPDGRKVAYAPAAWMSRRKDTAASVLAFVRLHRPDGASEKPAGKVMTAWYLWHCDASDSKAKRRAWSLLEEVFGPDFPGRNDMIEEVGRVLIEEAEKKGKK